LNYLNFEKTKKNIRYRCSLILISKIESHPDSKKILVALGIIDKRGLDREDDLFLLSVANSLFETGKLDNEDISNISEITTKLYKKIEADEGDFQFYFVNIAVKSKLYHSDHIMQGDPWRKSPWKENDYNSAYVSGKLAFFLKKTNFLFHFS
jgi:hypothetical protein